MGSEGGSSPVGGTDNGRSGTESDATETSSAADDTGDRKYSTCATCWQQIPPDSVRCPHCLGTSQSSGDGSETWSYDRIVLAVVPADGASEARASAATAFARGRTIVSDPDVSHGEVTLWAAVETAPSALTEAWPPLPDAVPLPSPAGQTLFEAAATRCGADEPTDPVIYCEDGATVGDGDEVETLTAVTEDADVQYWVVPGIVKRYQLPEEPDAFGDPLHCVDCGAVTEHDRVDEDCDTPERVERQRWACRVCGTQRYGPD